MLVHKILFLAQWCYSKKAIKNFWLLFCSFLITRFSFLFAYHSNFCHFVHFCRYLHASAAFSEIAHLPYASILIHLIYHIHTFIKFIYPSLIARHRHSIDIPLTSILNIYQPLCNHLLMLSSTPARRWLYIQHRNIHICKYMSMRSCSSPASKVTASNSANASLPS